jgi:hypothetical protein
MKTQPSSPQPIGATISLFHLQILAVEFLDTKFVCHVGLILDPSLFPFPFPLSAVWVSPQAASCKLHVNSVPLFMSQFCLLRWGLQGLGVHKNGVEFTKGMESALTLPYEGTASKKGGIPEGIEQGTWGIDIYCDAFCESSWQKRLTYWKMEFWNDLLRARLLYFVSDLGTCSTLPISNITDGKCGTHIVARYSINSCRYAGHSLKNCAVSQSTQAQHTLSAAGTVQVSHAIPAVRSSCLLRGRGTSFQDGIAAGEGFLCAPFLGVQICDYSAACFVHGLKKTHHTKIVTQSHSIPRN